MSIVRGSLRDDTTSFRSYMDTCNRAPPGRKWFAWRRVTLEDGETAWLKWVYRERKIHSVYDRNGEPYEPYYPDYTYRSLEAETLRRMIGDE